MIGCIIGDVIGSRYEGKKAEEGFELFTNRSVFTDDSILTLAICDALLNQRDYADVMKQYYAKYPYGRYGKSFKEWGKSGVSIDSYGNGSAMRVSPLAYAFHDKETIMKEAKKSALPTHGSIEGIMGAQAVAVAIFMAKNKTTKEEIKKSMVEEFSYDFENIKAGFTTRCSESVPQALDAFFRSESFEDAVRKAVLVNGDSDTLAAIAGSVAMPFYGEGLSAIDPVLIHKAFERMPDDLAEIAVEFVCRYIDAKFERPCKMSVEASFTDLFRSIFG